MDEANIYESFGPRLARLRQERGLSQRALAERLSVTRQAVSSWERSQTVPDLGTLERLCRVLEVDWNCLCGGTVQPPRRRQRYAVPALLAAALPVLLLLLLPRTTAPAQEPPAQTTQTTQTTRSVPWQLRGEVLHSHQATVMEAGPNGLQKKAAGDLAAQLEALAAECPAGAVEPAQALREGFSLAGEACEFRLLPAYEDGVFADRNGALNWLYYGLSRGAAPEKEQVDGWLAAWFDPACRWEHGSTENYPLTEEGVYRPEGSLSGECTYQLDALEHLEERGFSARLLVRETGGTGEVLPERTLELRLTAEAGQLCFSEIRWTGEPL